MTNWYKWGNFPDRSCVWITISNFYWKKEVFFQCQSLLAALFSMTVCITQKEEMRKFSGFTFTTINSFLFETRKFMTFYMKYDSTVVLCKTCAHPLNFLARNSLEFIFFIHKVQERQIIKNVPHTQSREAEQEKKTNLFKSKNKTIFLHHISHMA